MFDFKNCDKEELKEAFNETAQGMNVSGSIIEKDFWVCSVLKELFSIESLKNSLTFKGGTSLSKIYRIISRFSEDIDVSIDRKFLGFEGDKEPFNAPSNKKAKKLIEELGNECGKYVEKSFLSILQNKFKKHFSDHDEDVEIRVLNSERTFWEKATILHKYAHFPKDKLVPVRQSRHYYDFYCLLGSDAKDKALADLDLLKKVTDHKGLFFRSSWASYDTAKKGTLRVIPEKRVLDAMEKDYSAMSEVFFAEVPTWDEIVNALKTFEREFNSEKKNRDI